MKSLSKNSAADAGRSKIRVILLAWLIAGTLDITAALIDSYFRYGTKPGGLFRFIASGMFGTAAFSGSSLYIAAGLLFHYVIAGSWTILFFAVFPKLEIPPKYKILSGLSYGIIVWLVMNLIVLPLSGIPKHHFRVATVISGATYLMLCIGLPVSLIYHKYYRS